MHSGPAISRHRLGIQLRQLREAQSLRLETAAAKLGIAPSTLSRIETGKAPTKTIYLHTLLDFYGLDDPIQREQLAEMAVVGQHKEWWANHADLLPAGTGTYLGLEATASHVRGFAAYAVPALLQTRGYAEAFFKASRPELDATGIRSLVELQLIRQRPPELGDREIDLILDESVMLRSVGSRQVMADQLAHLVTLTSNPSLTIRVIRLATTQPVISPSFTLLTLPDTADPTITCLESIGGQVDVSKRATDIETMQTALEALNTCALSPARSAKLIHRYARSTG